MARYLVVVLSDIHLIPGGAFGAGTSLPELVYPRDNLVAALELIGKWEVPPDVFLLTGDLVHEGDKESYEDLAALMATAAKTTGADVVYLPGNHDLRSNFRRHLLGVDGSGKVGGQGEGQEGDDGGGGGDGGDGGGDDEIRQVQRSGGLRIVALDSLIPGEDAGELSDDSIEFLRAVLADPAPDGTIVAVHHPPIPSPIESMSNIRLRNPDRLRDAIAGSDVRIVVSGHNHHISAGMTGHVPVWVSPAIAYRADLALPSGFRGAAGGAFSRIDIDDDSTTVSAVLLT
ncbi:MAG: metallophosphoesterase family protein [Acidimicrobiales bacterium]